MRQHRWIIPLAALIAVAPLLVYGYSCGHDFDFHILNWIEVAAQWRQGILYPHWAVSPAFGAGEPRFIFYPPLSWMLGAILGLALPWNATPAAYTLLALLGCGLCMYRLAREWLAPAAALFAAIVYIVNPYMLFVAYERTAYAELLGAAWLPLLLLGILRRKVTIPGIAIPVALLWLTNAPAAVMGCYALALLAFLRLIGLYLADKSLALKYSQLKASAQNAKHANERPQDFAWKAIAGTLLGLALAAVYIVPAAHERRWVWIEMAMAPGMRIRDGFLFGHTVDADHDRVLWTASWIAVMLLAIVFFAAVTLYLRNKRVSGGWSRAAWETSGKAIKGEPVPPSRATLISLCALALTILLLQLPISAPIWNHSPELGFLQFPWRWLAVLSVVAALLTGLAFRSTAIGRKLPLATVLLLPIAVVPSAYLYFHQACNVEDSIGAQMQVFSSGAGSEATDEYTPVTADNDALTQKTREFMLADSPDSLLRQSGVEGDPAGEQSGQQPGGAVRLQRKSAEQLSLAVRSDRVQFLILRLRDYPAWRVRLNGSLVTNRPQRGDGLMAIPVPMGKSDIQIRYVHTLDERLGEIITGVALLVLAVLLLGRRRTVLDSRRAAAVGN